MRRRPRRPAGPPAGSSGSAGRRARGRPPRPLACALPPQLSSARPFANMLESLPPARRPPAGRPDQQGPGFGLLRGAAFCTQGQRHAARARTAAHGLRAVLPRSALPAARPPYLHARTPATHDTPLPVCISCQTYPLGACTTTPRRARVMGGVERASASGRCMNAAARWGGAAALGAAVSRCPTQFPTPSMPRLLLLLALLLPLVAAGGRPPRAQVGVLAESPPPPPPACQGVLCKLMNREAKLLYAGSAGPALALADAARVYARAGRAQIALFADGELREVSGLRGEGAPTPLSPPASALAAPAAPAHPMRAAHAPSLAPTADAGRRGHELAQPLARRPPGLPAPRHFASL